jgi:hypothetical protein
MVIIVTGLRNDMVIIVTGLRDDMVIIVTGLRDGQAGARVPTGVRRLF